MKLKSFLSIHILLLCIGMLVPAGIFAGTTGKITGIVTDANTGETLPGVNIVIEGTQLGAASGMDGDFSILNIPPGTYSVRASMIGYQAIVMEKVQVRIDLSSKVNFKMKETVLEADEVTIVAERPMVQMDETYSMSSVSADEIAILPVQSVNDVMGLQAGAVESGGLHIRGGRTGEVAYWVDGVSTTDVFSGGMGVKVENSAVQELQVVSGTFNAEYGQSMSGIVNIITKEGSQKYSGELKGYIGDYVTGTDIFDVWKSVVGVYDSTSGETTVTEDRESPLKKFNPIYNGEFSLSGPVPFMGDKLTFFVNGRHFSDEGYLYGREWYLPQGIPGDSSLVPMNPFVQTSTQAKLTWNPMGSIKMSYNVFWNEYQQDRTFDRNYKYVPGGIPLRKGGGTTHIFSFNHVLTPKTFYELRVNKFYNEYKSYVHDDATATPHWLVHVEGDSTYPETTLDLATDAGLDEFDWVKQQGFTFDYLVDPNDPDGYVDADSASDPASYSFYRAGNSLNRYFRSTAYWVGKFDVTSQVAENHTVKAGMEYRKHDLNLDDYTLQPKRKEGLDEEIVPFTPEIPDISTIYHNKYNRKPMEFSAYIQDKVEYKDVIFNIGLRFDYFDANSVVPADPTDINVWNPFKNEYRYKNWIEPPDSITGQALTDYYKNFEEYTVDERREFMHKKVDAKYKFSPRFAISYPITDKGFIHFSYGQFFQMPEFQYLYSAPDFKVSTGGGQSIIGNADLHPQRTTQYEIGLKQELTEDMAIDVALFYRDIRDWVGTSPLIQTYRPVVSYSIYENKDYSNVRGITVEIDKRYSNNYRFMVDYTFQIAEGTYSSPNDAFNSLQNDEEPRLNLIPLNWDQRHTLNAQFMYTINGWTATAIGRYLSGRPYTPTFAKGELVGGTALLGLRENSAISPNTTSLDCYLMKQFDINNFHVSAFIYAYNVLDLRSERTVYSDTGTSDYTTDPRVEDVEYVYNRIGSVADYLARPEWLVSPREIQLGFSIGF